MLDLAPDIFRKRLIIEGFFFIDVDTSTIEKFFVFLTSALALKTYAPPIIHHTGGEGKEDNQGYDAFVPLIDSGIYLAVWANKKFLSMIIYTCKDFDDKKAVNATKDFFAMNEIEYRIF